MTTAASGLDPLAAAPLIGPTNESLAALSGQDFLQMLITQLKNQDPTNPMDNKEVLEQLNTLRTLEANLGLMDAIQDLTLGQQVGSGAALLGREVIALAGNGMLVKGQVTSVLLGQDGVALTLAGPSDTQIPVWLSNVLEIREGTSDDGSDQTV